MATSSNTTLAQDIQDVQQRYMDALRRGDLDALVALFTEDAVLMPVTGGTYQGTDAIRHFYEQLRNAGGDLKIASTRTDDLGSYIFDTGTVTGTLRTGEGEATIRAEYITLAKKIDGDLKIYRLASFMRQQPPESS